MDFENTALPVCFSLGNVAPKSNYNTVYPKNRTERAVTVSPDSQEADWDASAVEIPHTSLSVPRLFLCPFLGPGGGCFFWTQVVLRCVSRLLGGSQRKWSPCELWLAWGKAEVGAQARAPLFLIALSRYRCSSMNTDRFGPLLRRETGGLPVSSPLVFGKV